MKKINLLFQDKIYEEKLKFFLKLHDESCEINIITSSVVVKDDDFLITDQDVEREDWTYVLGSLSSKYDDIENLYNRINEYYVSQVEKHKRAQVISFVNMYQNLPSNVLLENIYRELSSTYSCLLLDFRNLPFSVNTNRLSIDTLLLLDDKAKDISVNEDKGIKYLASSKLVIEIDKRDNFHRLLDIVKHTKYDYVFLDISSYINEKNIFLIQNSDYSIFYYSKLNQTIDFEVDNLFTKYTRNPDNILNIYQDRKTYSYKTSRDQGKTSYIKDMVNLLWTT